MLREYTKSKLQSDMVWIALPVLHEYVQPTNIKGMNFNKNVFIDEERKRGHTFPLQRKISIHLHQNNKKMLTLNKF